MQEYCNAFLNKKIQADSYYPSSYRSNFMKLGYEIPATLNPYYYKYLIGSRATKTELINSNEIDIGARADLLCKIMYLLSKRKNLLPSHLGDSVYRKHINVLSQEKAEESPEVKGIEYFERRFLNIYDQIEQRKKFDSDISVIPISSKSVLIDGAHRAAVGIVLEIKLPVKRLVAQQVPEQPIQKLLSQFKFSTEEYVQAIRVFLRYQSNSRFFVLHASRDKTKDRLFMSLLRNYMRIEAIFTYKIKSSFDSQRLVGSLYSVEGASWISMQKNKNDGLKYKAKEISAKNGKTVFLLCSPLNNTQSLNNKMIKEIKELGRSFYDNGCHSIHSIDSQEENIIAFDNLLASPVASNGPLINSTIEKNLLNTEQKLFLDKLSSLGIAKREQIIISGGMLMACLGIRPDNEIDIICDPHDDTFRETQNEFIETYGEIKSFKEIIFGDHGYLWLSYKGKAIRFLPLDIFVRAKQKKVALRGSKKDSDDLNLLENYLQGIH